RPKRGSPRRASQPRLTHENSPVSSAVADLVRLWRAIPRWHVDAPIVCVPGLPVPAPVPLAENTEDDLQVAAEVEGDLPDALHVGGDRDGEAARCDQGDVEFPLIDPGNNL